LAAVIGVVVVVVVQAFHVRGRLRWTAVNSAEAVTPAAAQQPASPLAPYIKVQAPVIALVHARVIDGTGAPAREDQTIVIRDGDIAAIGDAARTPPPAGATVVDLTGKSVLPGLVMMHEHLYYTTGPGVYGQLGVSFSRLYLAGGVTTMRTAGNVNGIMDINIARRIAAGEMPGPFIDATAPYVNGPNTFLQMHTVESANQARAHVQFWL
jgi:enamidase